MKKLLLTIGTAASTVAPLATTIACGTSGNINNGTVVTYAPDLDMAIALEMNVTSTVEKANQTSASTIALIEETGRFDKAMDAIKHENKPFWDFGEFDEEYWISLQADTLIAEYWVGAERRERMSDLVPSSVFFDYNMGVQGDEFNVQIANADGTQNKLWEISNRNSEIYGDPSDFWQLIDMPAFVRSSAASLDAQEGIDGKAELAEKIISRTDERWLDIRKTVLNDATATLPVNNTYTSELDADNMGTNLLSIGLSSLEATNPIIGTPANMKALYTKSGYNYPEITIAQAASLEAQGGNWAGMGNNPAYVTDTSQINNGHSFSSDETAFYADYNGKIDKMIIGLHDDIRNSMTKDELITELGKNSVVTSMFATDAFSAENIIFVNPYLSGSVTYNFRQPIAQNSVIDQIATEWLGYEGDDEIFTWW